MRLHTTRNRGYVLAETAVVIAIAVLILGMAIGAGIYWQRYASGANSRAALVRALGALSDATISYGAAYSSTFAPGVVTPVTIAQLQTAGDLDSSFSTTSPVGGGYAIAALRPAAGSPLETGVWLVGPTDAARLAHANITNTATSFTAFVMLATNDLAAQNRIAGTLMAGSAIATGSGNAWTLDLSKSLMPTTTATIASPVVISGFFDIGALPPASTPKYGNCQVVHPTLAVAPPVCPAGTTQVATWPFCGRINTAITPQYDVYTSPVGDITVGTHTVVTPTSFCSLDEQFPPCPSYPNSTTNGIAIINGAKIGDDGVCSTVTYGTQPPAPAPCSTTTSFIQSTCSFTTPNLVVTTQGANAIDALCCTPAN